MGVPMYVTPHATVTMQTIQDVLKHPNAIVTQSLHLEIATLASALSMIEFTLTEAMNTPFLADITVTSTDKHIEGAACIGRPAIFMIDEHASVPSLPGLIDPVRHTARTVHGIVTQWT